MVRRPLFLRSAGFASLLLLGAAPLALVLPAPALAADATIDQVYAEAKGGDVAGALGMMDQVLKDHPQSAKAHYIEAELLARSHRAGEARGELAKAESLAPGLPFASPRAVGEIKAELKAELNGAGSASVAGTVAPVPAAVSRSAVPWGAIVIIGLVVFGFLAILRRRSAPSYGPAAGGQMGAMSGGPAYGPGYGGPGYGAPGYGPGYGGGMGGGLLGGLAQGAAMGAGFAAGEELVDHMFGGGRERFGDPAAGGGWGQGHDPNADMGGQDFGISDAGSWDDGSGGGDGGW